MCASADRSTVKTYELVQTAIQTNKNTNDIAKINDKISTLATKENLKKVIENFINEEYQNTVVEKI